MSHMKRDTFSPHADLDAFLKAAVLALVAMMLVHGAVAAAAARVGQVSTNRSLEETLASLARQHAVMLAGTFVSAHDTLSRAQLLLLMLMMMLLLVMRGCLHVGLVAGARRTGGQCRRRVRC